MSDLNAFAFIYENLITLTEYGEGTRLCTFEPKKTLYVVKKVPLSAASVMRKLAELSSPRLARIFYVAENEEEGFAEAVCEYVGGEALTEYLRRAGGKLPEAQAVSVVRDVLEGLSLLHGVGIVHRDVNPNNVVITPSGSAMIIDYGIVRSFAVEKSADTVILGTPGYAAPEQFGFTQSDSRTDLYAVGVLLNVLLTGSLPNRVLTEGRFRSVVKKCVAIDPENRYSSAEAMLEDLKPGEKREEKTAKKAEPKRVLPTDRTGYSGLSGLPGLGSGSKGIRIFSAVLYLLFAAAVIAACVSFAVIGDGLFIVPFLIFCVLLPFLTFPDPWRIWERFGLTAYAPPGALKLFRIALGTLSLIVGIILFGVIAG